MKAFEPYTRDGAHSYALGLFPCIELLKYRPETARRLLLRHSAEGSEGAARLIASCESLGVRAEYADRALERLSGKENCQAAIRFDLYRCALRADRPHVVLHEISDRGNLGTIVRAALGFGVRDVAVIEPCVDPFDPRSLRASMGASFALEIAAYPSFGAYREAFPAHALYPFALDASRELGDVVPAHPWSLVLGNEARGLPPDVAACGQAVRIAHSDAIDSLNVAMAAGIGLYAFSRGGMGA